MYRKAQEVKERVESEKLLLYNINTRKLIVLEDMGIGVWNLLSEKSPEEIQEILTDYHPQDKEKIQRYLKKFIDDLVKRKFLVKEE
ncbi:MAG: PqqD family protein [Theionarchaea archaeon]|nr:PqqD family protein [Theionarchaea archaeon]